MDFSQVFLGLSVAMVVTAIVGAGTLLALPEFARWATDKVAGFFTDRDDDDDDADDEFAGYYFDMPEEECEALGHVWDGDHCGFCVASRKEEDY